jgi:hypothetical protein
MLRAIVAILAALGAVVGAIALLGSRLPVGHVASRFVVIGAPIDVVFGTIIDFSAHPSWRPDVKSTSTSLDPATGRMRVTEDSKTGRMTMEVEESIPPTRVVTRIVGDNLPYGGAWAYALEPQGNLTRITITEHGEVYNPVFRFISRYIMGHTGTIDTYLRNLGNKFGAPVFPMDAPPVPLSRREM